MLFINKRIFCVPSFVRFLLTFKMRELFLPHPVLDTIWKHSFMMVYQVVSPANQDQTDIAAPLLLDLKSHTDTINTKRLLPNASKTVFEAQEQTSGQNHWWHCTAAGQQLPPCNPHGAGPTECHATGSAQHLAYAPNISPVKFHILGSLKGAISGCTLMLGSNMQGVEVQ